MEEKPKYASDYLSNIQRLKSNDTQESDLLNAMRGTLGGAIVGGIVGLIIARSKKTNLMWGAFCGSLAGGLITKAFLIKKNSVV